MIEVGTHTFYRYQCNTLGCAHEWLAQRDNGNPMCPWCWRRDVKPMTHQVTVKVIYMEALPDEDG